MLQLQISDKQLPQIHLNTADCFTCLAKLLYFIPFLMSSRPTKFYLSSRSPIMCPSKLFFFCSNSSYRKPIPSVLRYSPHFFTYIFVTNCFNQDQVITPIYVILSLSLIVSSYLAFLNNQHLNYQTFSSWRLIMHRGHRHHLPLFV